MKKEGSMLSKIKSLLEGEGFDEKFFLEGFFKLVMTDAECRAEFIKQQDLIKFPIDKLAFEEPIYVTTCLSSILE